MTFVNLAGQAIKFAPQALEAASRLKTLLEGETAGKVVELAKQGAQSLSTSTTDGGISRAILNARELLPHLNQLVGSLNGHLTANVKGSLNELIALIEKGKDILDTKELQLIDDVVQNTLSQNLGIDHDEVRDLDGEIQGKTLAEVDDNLAPVADNQTIDQAEKGKKKDDSRDNENGNNQNREDQDNSQSTQGKLYTEEEVERIVLERLEKMGLGGNSVPKDPIDKILKGVSGIAIGEIKNKNSLFGLVLWMYGKATGNEINQDSVNKLLRGFIDKNFKGKLSEFIEAKVSGKTLDETFYKGLGDMEKTGITCVGKLIGLAHYVPDWAFDAIAASGQFIDTFAELLHHVPVLGGILKIPFVRKFYTDFSAFVGRFTATGDLQLISEGAKELKAKLQPAPTQN